MKKLLALTLSCLLILTSLVGCDKGNNSGTQATEPKNQTLQIAADAPTAGTAFADYNFDSIGLNRSCDGTEEALELNDGDGMIFWMAADESEETDFRGGITYRLRIAFAAPEDWKASSEDGTYTLEGICQENNLTIKVPDGFTCTALRPLAARWWYVDLVYTVPAAESLPQTLTVTAPAPQAGEALTSLELGDLELLWTYEGSSEALTLNDSEGMIFWMAADDTEHFQAGMAYVLRIAFSAPEIWWDCCGDVWEMDAICRNLKLTLELPEGFTCTNLSPLGGAWWTMDLSYTVSGAQEPAPTEPTPTEPIHTEPIPTQPKPTEPTPTEPETTQPVPTEPKPQLYSISCIECTFSGGGYTDATTGTVAAGTEITVTAYKLPNTPVTGWKGSYDAGTEMSFTFTVNADCSFEAVYYQPTRYYSVTCKGCTFTVPGTEYINQTTGYFQAGTVIEVTANMATCSPSYWSGSYDAGTECIFLFTVTEDCYFEPIYEP